MTPRTPSAFKAIVVAWPLFVAWIVERYFTFTDQGGSALALALALAVGPGLALSGYVLLRPRRHLVVARVVSIVGSVPAAVYATLETTTYDCRIDALCGTSYGFVPLSEWFLYGVVVALYTSGRIERCGGSRLLRRKPTKPVPPED
ncbi:MAG TPA: hypothetical protein VM938_01285 [Acidimicrobiales bacterium]|nr:hypothetical protein [Acidimicrobiales bacterium]